MIRYRYKELKYLDTPYKEGDEYSINEGITWKKYLPSFKILSSPVTLGYITFGVVLGKKKVQSFCDTRYRWRRPIKIKNIG